MQEITPCSDAHGTEFFGLFGRLGLAKLFKLVIPARIQSSLLFRFKLGLCVQFMNNLQDRKRHLCFFSERTLR